MSSPEPGSSVLPSAILPPATLGLLGGGQLGRYFVTAAHELGYEVWVLDPDPESPAGRIADRHLAAAYDDPGALADLARGCRAVTTEFENVPATTLDELAGRTVVRPSAVAVSVCQDRAAEKGFLAEHDLPHGPWAAVHDTADVDELADDLFPGVFKLARLSYDGKGQARVADAGEAAAAFADLGGGTCVLERELVLDLELSVVVARGPGGEVRCFAPAENRHVGGILHTSTTPARVDAALADEAAALAERIVVALGYVGTMGVELFVVDGRLLVNELAPRPHNSGHHTLDTCATSQFDQQVRALCGLALGDPAAHSAGVMVNLLGDLWADGGGRAPDWSPLLGLPGVSLHLYGKREARRGRKMGHVTVAGPDQAAVLDVAAAAGAVLGLPVP